MADQHDIQRSIIDMQAKRSALGTKKQHIQAELNKLKGMLPHFKQGDLTFDDIVKRRKELTAEVIEIDKDISDLKHFIKKRQALKEEVKTLEAPEMKAVQADLTALRDRYLKFAADKTRISSMRQMSAEFAEELTLVLKKSKVNV